MKINWDIWIKRDRGTLLFLGYTLLISAGVLFYLDFKKPVIKSKADLHFISGPITDFDFFHGNRGIRRYTLRLKNYTNTFQIKADFLGFFKSENFKSISPGKIVVIGIPLSFRTELNKGTNKMPIYSLMTESEIYLDYTKAIEKHNSKLIIFYSVLLVIIGMISIHFGNKAKQKTPIFW